ILPLCNFPHPVFLLAAFSMQLCVGLTVYMEFVDMKGVRYPELKLATMGWAIPMIVVGATLAAQVPIGFRLDSWWIQMQTNYFYAYSISVIIITVILFRFRIRCGGFAICLCNLNQE
ncbi:hypothetical protein CEXT_624231, partial [Caerostris extrusa]